MLKTVRRCLLQVMGEVLGFGKFACVEIKSFGEIFQEAICYKNSSGSGSLRVAKRLREPLRAAVLVVVL